MSRVKSIVVRQSGILLALGYVTFPILSWALPALPDARREIQEALRRSDDSLHRKDIQGCMAGFTQDFHGESINGDHFDRKQSKQSLTKSLFYAQSVTAHTQVKNIAFVNRKAIVVSQEHTVLTILGRRTHHLHTLVFDGLWSSVWIDTKLGWCEQSEKQLTSTATTDGIPKVGSPIKARRQIRYGEGLLLGQKHKRGGILWRRGSG